MRSRFGLVVALASLIAGAVLVRAQVIQPGPTYPLWEYRTETIREPANRERELPAVTLNSLGRDGWELAAMTRREMRVLDTLHIETAYVFKRSRGEARR